MSTVEVSLRRLQHNFSGFVETSALLRDAKALRIQIELRRRALQDIALIQRRLGSFLRGKKPASGRLQRTRTSRSRLAETFRAGRVRCQVYSSNKY
jgi:hypothetical protein